MGENSDTQIVDWSDSTAALTDHVSVLIGDNNGAYPSGNSVVVQGSGEAIIIDPSVSVVARGGAPVAIDAVFTSHGHEDHMAGNNLFADARVHAHDLDLAAVQNIDGLRDGYGMPDAAWLEFMPTLFDDFSYEGRPDAVGFRDGDRFDLGGVAVEAVHLPGHTAGHSGFRISGGVFFCSDIDLTGFGPYYGDAWSDLDQFEASLDTIASEEARYYVTFHHKGIIEGRAEFVERLNAFRSVIQRRDAAMLEFLNEPRTIDEMVARRFVYRPNVEMTVVDVVERRTAELHVERMIRRGQTTEVEPGRFQKV